MTYSPDKQYLDSVFGEQVNVSPTPVIQISGQYEIDPPDRDDLEVFEATGGSSDANGNMFRCQTGTSLGGYGVIRSSETLVYRAGQGAECRITGKFTTGVALSLQFAGLFSLTETAAFGYDGADFSIIHQYNGQAEYRTLQVTGGASGSETATVTINGDAVSCSLTNSSVQENAFEIERDCVADATVGAKWRIQAIDDTVYFIARATEARSGTYSFSSSTATATWAQVKGGAAKSDGNVAQASWNITSTPFTGFDPTKLNLYRIEYGYLGAVSCIYSIYNADTGLFVPVHRIKWANNNTTPIFGSPDMKVGWTAASLGSTGTNLTVEGASAYTALDGVENFRNQSFANDNSVASIGTTLTPLITLKNRITYGKRFNLGKIKPLSVSVDNDHNKGAIIEIYRNADVTGGSTVPDFQFEEETNSIAIYDGASNSITGGMIIDAFTVAATLEKEVDLEKFLIELGPDESITVASKTISGTGATHTASLAWIEEK